MVYLSFDIYHKAYSVLLNLDEGLATTTLCGESFAQLFVLRSVLL